MKSAGSKYWSAVKFGCMLGLKYSLRVLVAPVIGACRGLMKEADRANAEIDAFNAKLFGEVRGSGGAEGPESKSEFQHLAR
jgi:hypothetical protein